MTENNGLDAAGTMRMYRKFQTGRFRHSRQGWQFGQTAPRDRAPRLRDSLSRLRERAARLAEHIEA
jgi:hypothetical protein